MRGPDFLVVGAPKCGTTALFNYLSQNPRLFVAPKEPHFFGSDLRFLGGQMSRSAYEALFPATDAAVRGDVSVWYLYSHTAAREICDFNPNAKIIIMLRNPVDQMYSLHSQALYTVDEDEPSFARALALESDRRAGAKLPRHASTKHAVFYREIAKFSTQVRRYHEYFSTDRIHFILLDDMKYDPHAVWSDVHRFLDVEPGPAPVMDPANPNKVNRSNGLASAAAYVPRFVIPRLAMDRLPRSVKDRMIGAHYSVVKWNRTFQARSPMDPALRGELVEEFRPEVDALEEILGRDLSQWRQ